MVTAQSFTRRGAIASAGVLGGALLAACGATGTGGEAATKNHPPVKLSTDMAHSGQAPPVWGAYAAADKAINAKYPWLTMEWLSGNDASFAGMQKLVVSATAGTLPDLFYAQGTQIQFYINNKIAASLSTYLNKDKAFDLNDFPKVAIDMYSRGGQVYATPYDHGPILLYYNVDLFKKGGVPLPTDKWTWDDLADDARRLTDEAQGQWGLLDDGPSGGFSMGSYLGPWGGEWIDATETRTQITSSPSMQALQYWYDLWFKHKVNPVPGSYQGSNNDLYLQGKLGMVLGGPWSYRNWVGKLNFESPIANWPLGPTGKRISASMGSGLAVAAPSKYKDEAWLYMSELHGKDPERSVLQQFVKTGGGTPVRVSVMKEFEKSKFAPPNAQIVSPAATYSVIGRPIAPIKVDLDTVWSEERPRLLKQEIGLKEMADAIARRVQPFLDRNKGWDAQK